MKLKLKTIVLGVIALAVVGFGGDAWAERDGAKEKEFRALQKRTERLGKAPKEATWSQLLNDVRAWAKKHGAELSEHSEAATGSSATSSLSPCKGKIKKKVGSTTVDCWLVPNKSTSTRCFYICTGL